MLQGINIREMLAGAALMDEATRTIDVSIISPCFLIPLSHMILIAEILGKSYFQYMGKFRLANCVCLSLCWVGALLVALWGYLEKLAAYDAFLLRVWKFSK